MNILYIDDCADTVDFMKDLLEEEGFNVLTCLESHQSLKLLSTHKIHCVITDLNMPILEGEHLISLIKHKYPKLPVIVLSAHIKSRDDILSRGAYEALKKPVDTNLLIETIYNALADASQRIMLSFDHTNLKKIRNICYARVISVVLKQTHGNHVKASELLGISRQSLIRYIKYLNISTPLLPPAE